MSSSLPPRPNFEWLRKRAKKHLAELRAKDPNAKLADAQRELARTYGFSSWRALKTEVEKTQHALTDDEVKAFFRAVGTGQIDEVRRTLDEHPAIVNASGPHPFWGGRPQALHVAIESDRGNILELLLERGADVNGSNDAYDHWSPLMLAIQRGRISMRDELLRRGARVGLVEALMLGDDAFLSGVSALPNETPNGASLLAFARTQHAIECLIALGASTTSKDRWGTTPIQALSALGASGTPLVRSLIAHGATASALDYARLGDLDAIMAMNERDDEILMAAVDRGHHAMAAWLLEHDANPNARAKAQSRQTALHSAAWNGDLQMVQILVGAGADPNLVDEEHRTTPRHWAEVSFEIRKQPGCREVAEYLARSQV